MKKTLIIHPEDPTTDFLKVIYEGRGFSQVHRNFDSHSLKAMIHEHDRIVMLGHGYHHGLLHYFQPVIDASFVPYLQQKELVGIWCFAKAFFDAHGLSGFHTDMFISETAEAQAMGISATEDEIQASNYHFAQSVRKNLFHLDCLHRVSRSYFKLQTPVSNYNAARLHFRNPGDPIEPCDMPDFNEILTNPTMIINLINQFFK